MFILFIVLVAIGAPAVAAIAARLWGATTEDWERSKRAGFCLLALALAAISAAIAWVCFQSLKLVTWGEIDGKPGAYLVAGVFIMFAALCLLPIVARKEKRPNQQAPEPAAPSGRG